MNNGILVQHQPNPKMRHLISTFDDQEIIITSTHHQAAFPFLLPTEKYKVLAWTNFLPFHQDGDEVELNPPKECEIVYYSDTKCLGIQGHPEMMVIGCETIDYLRDMLNKFMNNTLANGYIEKSVKEQRLATPGPF